MMLTLAILGALAPQLAKAARELMPAPDGIDPSPYVPNDAVESHGTEGVFKASGDYITGVVTGAIVFVVIGSLMWLLLVCWNCCSCMCWKQGKKEGSAKKKLVAVVLLAISVLACFISFMVLLANVGELQEFIIRIPKAVDFLTYWKTDTTNILDDVIIATGGCALNPGCDRQATSGAYITSCEGNSTASTLTPQNAFLGYTVSVNNAIDAETNSHNPTTFRDAKEAVTSAYTAMNSSLTDISTELKAIDLGLDGFKDAMGSAADGLDILNTIFWLCFLIVFVQGLVALANMTAPPKWQPRKACWCLQPCLTFLYLWVFLLIWVFAFIFYVIVTLNADLCIQFDASLLDLVNSNNNDSLAFYIRCDEDSTLNNPMADPIRILNESLISAKDARAALTTMVEEEICTNVGDGNILTNECIAREVYTLASGSNDESQRFIDDCLVGDEHINNSTLGKYDSGTLLGQLGCTAFNSRFQAMANLMCNDAVAIQSSFFSAFLAIGIFMFVIEVIRKEMRGESEKGKNKRVSKSKVTPIEA